MLPSPRHPRLHATRGMRVALLPFSASFPHPSTTLSYTQAANKQMQSMSTLFPSSELDKKLSDATNNEPGMPSSGLLYELGRATHRDDDYRIVTAAIWQAVLRTNQRPRVVLKTLCVLEAVLLHGPDRALEETIDMKTDIKALQSFSHSDFGEAGKVQQKAADILELLEDGSRLQQRRTEAGAAFGEDSKPKYQGFSSDNAPKSPTKPSGGGGLARLMRSSTRTMASPRRLTRRRRRPPQRRPLPRRSPTSLAISARHRRRQRLRRRRRPLFRPTSLAPSVRSRSQVGRAAQEIAVEVAASLSAPCRPRPRWRRRRVAVVRPNQARMTCLA